MSCVTRIAAYLLGIAAMLLGLPGATLARIELEPVQHVYPDSTYQEIQQAIDNGGTVYFHRLTRLTGQYGEYDQIASSTPDVPATSMAAARDKGFFIGKFGKDVDIIGILAPNGSRPKINGGTVVFRVGIFARMGILGLPVNFRIENLELANPDMADAPLMKSRIGIMVVSVLGAQSIINNCKFTIIGKQTDPGHQNNHSVAIWYYLVNSSSATPPVNGARIDITNNTVIASGVHEGIHVDNYWPVTPGYTAPRTFVSNNTLHLRNLCGYPNQNGTNGATVGAGILVVGNLSDSIVTNNAITGDGRSPGLTPRVESVAVRLGRAGAAGTGSGDQSLSNVTVAGNDFSSFASDFHLLIGSVVVGSTIGRNSIGPADRAGVMCDGHDNQFVNNHFYGPYLGWAPPASGPGLFWFTTISSNNTVEATKLNGPSEGADICGQVLDESVAANNIRGYEKCR